MKFDLFLIKSVTINSKWVIDLDVKAKAVNTLKKSYKKVFENLDKSNISLERGTKIIDYKIINKLDFIKIKTICFSIYPNYMLFAII